MLIAAYDGQAQTGRHPANLTRGKEVHTVGINANSPGVLQTALKSFAVAAVFAVAQQRAVRVATFLSRLCPERRAHGKEQRNCAPARQGRF